MASLPRGIEKMTNHEELMSLVNTFTYLGVGRERKIRRLMLVE